MKDYDEMAKSVLQRRDQYVARRRRQHKQGAALLSCLCLVTLMGVGVWRAGLVSLPGTQTSVVGESTPGSTSAQTSPSSPTEQEPTASQTPTTSQDDAMDDAALQQRIQELQSDDSLGWLVVDGKVYLQSDFSVQETEADAFLGMASGFVGNYHDPACDGYVYECADNPAVLYIKLTNGGTVVLAQEDGAQDISAYDTGALNGTDDVWVQTVPGDDAG
jgi:hypothetical protein